MSEPERPPVDLVTVARQSVRPAPSRARKLASVLRVLIPLALLGYLLTLVSVEDVVRAVKSIELSALGGVVVAILTANFVAAMRWRLTFRACGVKGPISVLHLFRLFWIGAFYNAYVPGGLGGDVVRAVATRELLGEKGMAGSLAVAFLDRVLGLIGLLLLVTTSFTLSPLPGVPHVMLFSALGLSAAFGAIAALTIAPKLAPRIPGVAGRLLAGVPRIVSYPRLIGGMGLSVLTQASMAMVGHLVVSSITPEASLSESVVIMPLVLASQYFPLAVGGNGVREIAFVGLYGLVGVAKHDALAASLVVGMLQYAAATPGGIAQMLWPLRVEAPSV